MGGVRSQAKDGTLPNDVKGETHHGIPNRMLLRRPVHRVQGVNQVNLLSSTIFIMVLDAVIHHWETRLFREDAVTEDFGREVQKLAAPFYTYE